MYYSIALPIMACCLASVALNGRVFCVVVNVGRRRLKPAGILVAHLSFMAICYAFIGLLYFVNKLGWMDLRWPGVCQLLFFLEYTIYAAFPLNVVSIIYESIRSRPSRLSPGMLILKITFFIWVPAIMGSLPAIFMADDIDDPEDLARSSRKCKQVLLFGSWTQTLIYETLRFLAFHVMVVPYVSYAMCKIKWKLRNLSTLRRRIRRKVEKVRFVYLHSILFILVWLPVGILKGLYMVLVREGFEHPYARLGAMMLTPISIGFFMLSPLIYVGFIAEISGAEFCLGRALVRRCSRRGSQSGGSIDEENEISAFETSRFSTVANTPNSSSLSSSSNRRRHMLSVQLQTAAVSPTSLELAVFNGVHEDEMREEVETSL